MDKLQANIEKLVVINCFLVVQALPIARRRAAFTGRQCRVFSTTLRAQGGHDVATTLTVNCAASKRQC